MSVTCVPASLFSTERGDVENVGELGEEGRTKRCCLIIYHVANLCRIICKALFWVGSIQLSFWNDTSLEFFALY